MILALAQFMVVLDTSVVNVALPAVAHAFHLSQTTLQWVLTAYTLTFGGFLLLGGRAADLYGRRRMFMIGVTCFAIASLLDGLSQSGTMLITLRAVQGLTAAFMSPAALSIVLVTYREGHERNIALSVWGAVASGGAAAGVLLGGIITQYLDWRWNFFVNVPVGLFVLIMAFRLVPAHEAEEKSNELDLPGAVLVTAGMMTLVYGLVEAPTKGWTAASTLIYFGISILLLAGFIINEQRTRRPLVPLSIFKIRNVSGADLMQLPIAASLYSVFFFSSLYIQTVLGYSPVRTGFSFLAVPIAIAITATNAPRVVQKIGYKKLIMMSPLLIALGLFMLGHLPVDGHYFTNILPGMLVMGLGLGFTFVGVTIAATSGVPPKQSGLASGLLNTSQQIGGALGLAILTGVASAQATHYAKAHHGLSSAALVHGYNTGFYVAVGFAILAALIATFVIKQQAPAASSEPAIPAA